MIQLLIIFIAITMNITSNNFVGLDGCHYQPNKNVPEHYMFIPMNPDAYNIRYENGKMMQYDEKYSPVPDEEFPVSPEDAKKRIEATKEYRRKLNEPYEEYIRNKRLEENKLKIDSTKLIDIEA